MGEEGARSPLEGDLGEQGRERTPVEIRVRNFVSKERRALDRDVFAAIATTP